MAHGGRPDAASSQLDTSNAPSTLGLLDGEQRAAEFAAVLGRHEQIRRTVAFSEASVDQPGVQVAMIEPTEVPAAFEQLVRADAVSSALSVRDLGDERTLGRVRLVVVCALLRCRSPQSALTSRTHTTHRVVAVHSRRESPRASDTAYRSLVHERSRLCKRVHG